MLVVVSFDGNQPVRALATRRHDEILKRLGAQGAVRIGRCGTAAAQHERAGAAAKMRQCGGNA